MNEDLRERVQKHIIDKVEGGTTEGIFGLIDYAIEEGFITQEEYCANEFNICAYIDGQVFDCVVCGWTLPVSEGGEDRNGELACLECSPEEY